MHTFVPNIPDRDDDSPVSAIRNRIARFVSPSHRVSNVERYSFSMFYTVSHVFTLMNTLLYWAVLAPAGHGGFKFPSLPHHHHGNQTGIFYEPSELLFASGVSRFWVLLMSHKVWKAILTSA